MFRGYCKQRLSVLLILLVAVSLPHGFCACVEPAAEEGVKSEIPVGSLGSQKPVAPSTAPQPQPQPTGPSPLVFEEYDESLLEFVASANISQAQETSTDEIPVEFENFAADTFIKDCKCGRLGEPAEFPFKSRQYDGEALTPSHFVINGEATGEHEFKWMVGIAKKRIYDPAGSAARVICGATLINSRFLLTAAHCIHNELPERYYLLFRTHNLTQVFIKSSPGKIASAKRFIPHPRWDVKVVANDIGLIELQEPIDFEKEPNIRPACLPTPFDGDFAGTEATAVGWGYTKPKGAMATVLQKVTVPVMSHADCIKTRYQTMVTPSMVCAGYPEGQKDACTNDSGGPLTVASAEGYHKVIGVTSWGHGCAQPNAPGVYTRVTKYLNWIRSVVKGSDWCTPN